MTPVPNAPSVTLNGANIIFHGEVIVDGLEDLIIRSPEGYGATVRWSRDDDNTLINGSSIDFSIELPNKKPLVNVVHSFVIRDDKNDAQLEMRLFVHWVHEWSRIVTYTLIRRN